MSTELISSRIAKIIVSLAPKAKQPNSSTVLNAWIAQAKGKLGPETRGGRLGWLVASSVAIAAVRSAPSILTGGNLFYSRAVPGCSTG